MYFKSASAKDVHSHEQQDDKPGGQGGPCCLKSVQGRYRCMNIFKWVYHIDMYKYFVNYYEVLCTNTR